jgi:methyl-accepting chemotaxis protein
MRLGVRIPLLFGIVVLFTSAVISVVSMFISSGILKDVLFEAMHTETNTSSLLLSARLNGQLDIISEIAARYYVQDMNWEAVRSSLVNDIARIGAVDMALITLDGNARFIAAGTSINVSDREYFKQAVKREQYVEVAMDNRDNTLAAMFAVPVFMGNAPGAPVAGVLTARKDGITKLTNMVAGLESSMQTGQYFLVDKDGTYIGHHDAELVKNRYNPINEAKKDKSLVSLASAVQQALEDREGFSSYSHGGNNMMGYYAEVEGFPWILFNSMEEKEMTGEINKIRDSVVLVSLFVVLVCLVLSAFLGRSIARPIHEVSETLKDIAEGEGDLTHVIPVKSKDEIGDLALYFNETLEKIKHLVISIRKEAFDLSGTAADLAGNMNQTAAAVNEITTNIQSIKGRILNQSASVSETHATMENVTGTISKLNNHIEKQTASISKASSAIEEMVANTRSVTETLFKNAANVKTLNEASEVGRTGLKGVSEDIQEIARESEGLLEINSVMQNIASQTNLLSMNAAIEAAHAGDSGKGFAVVADEIRKLAENSSVQSKTITAVLKKIKESIDKITLSTGNVLDKFGAIDTSVKVVADQEENIRNAMEEQGEGSKMILEGVSHMNEVTIEVRESSKEMLMGSKEVIKESENLEKITHELAEGINEMACGASEINIAIHHVNEITVKNREAIELLMNEVQRFKVD